MKKLLVSSTALLVAGTFIYLSGVYLVKAELSFRHLEQQTSAGDSLKQIINTDAISLAANTPPEPTPPEPLAQPMEVLPPPEKTFFPAQETIPETSEVQVKEDIPVKPEGPPRISMDFENANLKDVLKIFCQQSGLNFIAGENIQMRPITLYLKDVLVEDALDSIIRANGLAYERAEGSNVFIVTKSTDPELKLETKIFKLHHAFVEDKISKGTGSEQKTVKGVKETVQKLLTQYGDFSIDPRTNSLIITDIPSRFPLIEQSIADLDSQLPQILIEARIVEITETDLDQIGIKWTSLAGYTFGYKDAQKTYESSIEKGKNTDNTATISQTDGSAFESITEAISPGSTTRTDTTTLTRDNSVERVLTDIATRVTAKTDLRSAVLSAADFNLTLSLLFTDTNVDMISSPNIVSEHSKEAKITVGKQYPIPQFAFNSETATFEVQGFEYKDIGIILRVTPYADTKKDSIMLELHPEVSSVKDFVNFQGVQIPIIDTREAITNVSIKHGDTLAIGGLLEDSDRKIITKVPLLGDIPILGWLFKHNETVKVKTNMIIFITPHILRDGEFPQSARSEVSVQLPAALPDSTIQEPTAKKSTDKDKPKYQFTHK